jgi:hypothetical protein
MSLETTRRFYLTYKGIKELGGGVDGKKGVLF